MNNIILIVGGMYNNIGLSILKQYKFEFHTVKDTSKLDRICNSRVIALIVRYPIKLDESFIKSFPNLLLICSSGRGTDNINTLAATHESVLVMNNPKVSAVLVAEHTFALILGLAKNLLTNHSHVKNDNYAIRNSINTIYISEKTLEIVGLGSIGSRVSSMCSLAFSMKVLAYNPYVSSQKASNYGAEKVSLDKLLKVSDFVSLHCTLNEETNHLIDYNQILKMKRTSFLINTARGPVVSTEALSIALKNQMIKAAALDVYEIEPPTSYILSSLNYESILLSPHNAGVSFECSMKLSNSSAQNIVDAMFLSNYSNCVNYSNELIVKFKEKKSRIFSLD
uniref:hypothetical protein n=1 Tax=Anunuuluaehu liula TaxID=3049639 RepID=UPI0030011333